MPDPWWVPWIPVATGFVGGVGGGLLTLGGQFVSHYLTGRRELSKRKAEAEDKALADLKDYYVRYLVELNEKARITIDFIQKVNASQDEVRAFISKFHLLSSSDVYFRVRMLEKNPEGAAWVKKVGESDEAILRLAYPQSEPTCMDLLQAAKPALLDLYAFQEWIYTKRFGALVAL